MYIYIFFHFIFIFGQSGKTGSRRVFYQVGTLSSFVFGSILLIGKFVMTFCRKFLKKNLKNINVLTLIFCLVLFLFPGLGPQSKDIETCFCELFILHLIHGSMSVLFYLYFKETYTRHPLHRPGSGVKRLKNRDTIFESCEYCTSLGDLWFHEFRPSSIYRSQTPDTHCLSWVTGHKAHK